MRSKTRVVYCGEGVKVQPLLNQSFRATGLCSQCRDMSCAPGWHSIKTGEFRCVKCFDAEAEAG